MLFRAADTDAILMSIAEGYLMAWGRMARRDDPANQIGWQPMTPVERLVHHYDPSLPDSPVIDQVDRMMQRMSQVDRVNYQLAHMLFARRLPPSDVRRQLGIGSSAYKKRLYAIKTGVFYAVDGSAVLVA